MSSLKDIMDVDLEPLESQAMRSRQAAQQQKGDPDQSGSPSKGSPKYDTREQPQVSRRKSNRVSKSSSQGSSSRPGVPRRRSSGTAESMDSDGQSFGSATISRQTSRGSNPPESVRYTPVTGRVSRAKKGQPVHVCDQCDPPRVFTRAEHLRRHQLGHGERTYTCTVEDCEKAFHRPDLLARHVNRHETQGDAYKPGDARSGSPSSASEPGSPHFKVQTPSTGENPSPSHESDTANPVTPRTTASTGGGMTALPMAPSFGGVSISGHSPAGQYDPVGLGPSGSAPATSAASPNVTIGTTAFSPPTMNNLSQPPSFVNINMFSTQDSVGQVYPVGSSWCSSDSNWSTPSERQWVRGRSVSVTASPENWTMAWPPPYTNSPLQTPRTGLGAVLESDESPPYLSPLMSPNASYPLAGGSGQAAAYQELVGIPAPSSLNSSHTQSSSAPIARLPKSKLAGSDRRTNVLVDVPNLVSPSGEANAVSMEKRMEEYLTAYRLNLEPVYSIIHPHTFKSNPNDFVRKAVAALGSQFHILPGDRKKGSQLHESCLRLIQPHSHWDFQTMQAIFLTEVFGRFRSQKIDVRPSSAFRRLYRMLVESSAEDVTHRFARVDFHEISSLVEMEIKAQNRSGSPKTPHEITDNIWQQWVEWEVRQRLRSACFMFDSHQKFCYEQRRCQPKATAENTFIKLPCPESLWIATTSQRWFEHIRDLDCAAIPLEHPEGMSAEKISSLPLSSQACAATIAFELLPSRDQVPLSALGHGTNVRINTIMTLFPHFIDTHAYLALYHSPLHQLLSLTGNTWLFGQKLTDHTDIDAIFPTVRVWASSPAAAQATWHACHLLKLTIRSISDVGKPFRGVNEYWFMYTSTLIVWAFGYRHPIPSVSASSNAGISRRASSVTLASEDATGVRSAALAWIEAMIDLKPERLTNSPLRIETGPVIDAARMRLREETVMSHGQSGMLLDAIGVLDRIREGRKWF